MLGGFDAESDLRGGSRLVKLFNRPPYPRPTPHLVSDHQHFAAGLDSVAPRVRPGSVVVELVRADARVPAQYRVRQHLHLCRDPDLKVFESLPGSALEMSSPVESGMSSTGALFVGREGNPASKKMRVVQESSILPRPCPISKPAERRRATATSIAKDCKVVNPWACNCSVLHQGKKGKPRHLGACKRSVWMRAVLHLRARNQIITSSALPSPIEGEVVIRIGAAAHLPRIKFDGGRWKEVSST